MSMVASPAAVASVVITGTRVIYPGDAREKTLQLTNEDAFANVVQAWVDIDDPASSPDTADAPFMVNPPVSRMAPGSGQSLRLMYTGPALAQDRESLFYLNVLQIPPRNTANGDRNQMLLMLRNRLKLFYRPPGIVGSVDTLHEQLRFQLVQGAERWYVEVRNDSGYHASFGSAALRIGDRTVALQAMMVPPMSTVQWAPTAMATLPAGRPQLQAQLINDFGARIDIRHDLAR
ncbi:MULTISPECIES: fimbrial biogenesis chaperone [unclassified Pseudomonas]|uniref:fimbrial biogenesis chaperone n=1 Tax=unclassified Pseudomonas TaxID=196821 RepID=UPI001F304B8B|nr:MULTISPECIES: molecular chaperone [unclassified Pseudomonas]